MKPENQRTNSLGQPIGVDMSDWSAPGPPNTETLVGRYCTLEALDPDRHAVELFESFSADEAGRNWTYMPYGPFATQSELSKLTEELCDSDDALFFAIRDSSSGKAVGFASYLGIVPEMGSIEVGHVAFAPALQRTRAGTEAMYLMMKRAFDWGYRRYEWKCDSLNAGSHRAAERYGFKFEGIFRQARVYKGRSRDTTWFSIIDSEWLAVRARFEAWLDLSNFDDDGQQMASF
jgi:RimJ/RimL family protein N-acetyltransferase